jgi:hypothetical protein
MDQSIREMVYGHAQLRSLWFSNRWKLLLDDKQIATMHRMGRIYTTVVELPSGARWILDPHGNGVVRALDNDGKEFARVVRRSWIGRRWDLLSQGWNYDLISHPRPRAWAISIGGAPAAEIRGSLISYNKVDVHAMIGVPLAAVLLSWHVIARPWEAVAEPSGLRRVSAEPDAEPRFSGPLIDDRSIRPEGI